MEEALLNLIDRASKKGKGVSIGTGLAINIQDSTCDVARDGLPNLLGARLTAIEELGDSYMKITPVDKSPVVYALIDGQTTESVIINCSKIASIEWVCEVSKLNGDNQGGLVIAQKVSESDNSIIQEINQLKQLITSWTPVVNDGGAALKAALSSWVTGTIEPTSSADFENTKVKHGN
ncbi:MAG: hypothetical protein PHQ74_14970 [Crocinitomicaceae bacterium]|nr:hypothetical protein [Crocinitomicaceae bacterium]